MLNIKPIPEEEADPQIRSLYKSIKLTFRSTTVPLIFQYLARFPDYLNYLYPQITQNVDDPKFRQEIRNLEVLAQGMIKEIYVPGSATQLFVKKIEGRGEQLQLKEFAGNLLSISAALLLISLSLREGVKGANIGIRQIAARVSKEDTALWNDLSEGFPSVEELPTNSLRVKTDTSITPRQTSITATSESLVTTPYQEFFKLMQWKMDKLVQKQGYLLGRVELEKYALTKLSLFPYPLKSSFRVVADFTKTSPLFPELIYLLAEIFPTQTPYRLLAAAVMSQSLVYRPNSSVNDTSVSSPIILPPPKEEQKQ